MTYAASVTEPAGRRERKKAATRQNIADTALRLFADRGFDGVGIREIAAEADVAITTVFAHFASKEELVFFHDRDFERELTQAVVERDPARALLPDLRRHLLMLVRHSGTDRAATVWRLVDATPGLREYETAMRVRHAESLAQAIAGGDPPGLALRAVCRLVIDVYALARGAEDPEAAVDELMGVVESAWAALPRPPAT